MSEYSCELETEDSAIFQLEETIRRNTRVFQALLRQSHEGILLVTPEMTVLRLIHPLMGYPESELIGLPILSLVHPKDVASVSEAFSSILTQQTQTTVCEYRTVTKDGACRWLELQMTDLLDDPDVEAVLFNYRDITQRKQHEEMAQCMAAYLACPEYAMFTQDLDGVVLDWNPGAERAFGYSAGQIIGQNFSLLIPPDLLDQEVGKRAEIAQGKDITEYATTRVHRDGQSIPVLVKLSAVPGTCTRAIAQISRIATI
jgi:PAS domain S-box-containing protein